MDIERFRFCSLILEKQLINLDQKRELKFEYQVLVDIVAKGILSKSGLFAAITLEKFQVMTAIIKGMKINWSSILFNIFKNMFQTSNKSKDFVVQLSFIIEDCGIIMENVSAQHKYKVFN